MPCKVCSTDIDSCNSRYWVAAQGLCIIAGIAPSSHRSRRPHLAGAPLQIQRCCESDMHMAIEGCSVSLKKLKASGRSAYQYDFP